MDTDKEEKQRKERRRDDDERRREKSKRSRSRSPKERRDRDDDRHRRKRQRSQSRENRSKRDRREPKDDKPVDPPRKAKDTDMINTRTGGAYIPPAKLRMMQAQITDKTTAAYQRLAWEALKKSIHGHINKINVGNCGIIIKQLLKENIVRGRGLLCRSIIQAQAASLTFTNVYAALAAAINSRFPNIGELLLKRLVIQFKRGFKRNDKALCISSSTFIAHLVNQRVAHEILALELLTLLVETPTDDSVEVAIAFLKECGQKLTEVSSRGVHAIFDMLRNILHEGQLDKRVQYMIEVMFQIWKDGFKDHPAMIEELELVPEEDQFTHLLTLDDADDPQDLLNVFKLDEKFEENEQKYKTLCKEILGSDVESDEDNEGDDESGSGESEEEGAEDDTEKSVTIIDNTETNLVALRRTIYLTINSSLDFEECAHKLLKMELKPGQEKELCNMFLDCCAEQRTYEKFYGLLAQRFCQINKIYIEPFEEIFKDSYGTAHRLDTNRLRNVSKFFAHLLFTDSISWEVLECVKLNEEDTTSSSRIYIKILFQELAEYMGLKKLHDRLNDPTLSYSFSGLFPRDNPKNTRFSINFFTSIGLGGLTDELREHLKNMPKNVPPTTIQVTQSSSSSSSSSSSDSSSDSSTDSSDSDEDDTRSSKKKDRSGKEKTGKSSKTQEMEGDCTEKDKDEQRWDHGGFYENYGQGARRYEPQNRDKYERRSGRDDRRYKDNNRQDRDEMEKRRKDRKERDGKYTDNGRDRGETERRRDDKKQRYERDNTYEYDKHKDDRRERDKTREDRHRDETESRRGDRDDYYDNYKDYELDRGETERRRDNRTDKLDKNDKGKKRYEEDKRKDRTEKSKKNKYRDEEERSSDKRDKRSEKENKYDKQRESDDSDDEYYRDKDKSNKKDYRYDKERDGDMQDKHSQKRDKFDKRIEQEKEKDDKRQHKVASKVEVAPNAANDWERDSDTEKPELGRYWDVGVKAQ